MCGDWESLDAIVDRLVKGLVATGEGGATPIATMALAPGEGRAHDAEGGGGIVIEFRPREKDAGRSRRQVEDRDRHGRGNVSMPVMTGAAGRGIARRAKR